MAGCTNNYTRVGNTNNWIYQLDIPTTIPELRSLEDLWLREFSVNPGEVLAQSRGNLIQLLSNMRLAWSGAGRWSKSHEISLNLSKVISKISSSYV